MVKEEPRPGSLRTLLRFQSKDALNQHSDAIRKNKTFRSIVSGLFFFVIFAGFVVIPLLSSVDADFKNALGFIPELIASFFEHVDFAHILQWLMTFTFFGAIGAFWLTQKPFTQDFHPRSSIDSISTGIVLGGTLMLYALFLLIQVKRLFIGELPLDFKTTESFVKSGFWQFFVLTILNILFVLRLRKAQVQNVVRTELKLLIVSSVFLALSVAQRILLYNTVYGLSYEKFFAGYTILFCIGAFLWLGFVVFFDRDDDICKSLLTVSLWSYAIMAVLPLERFMWQTNLELSKRPESRVVLDEMRMFSGDVADLAEKYARSDTTLFEVNASSWNDWFQAQCNLIYFRRDATGDFIGIEPRNWYEKSLSGIAHQPSRDVCEQLLPQ
jgi:hypothetical protein